MTENEQYPNNTAELRLGKQLFLSINDPNEVQYYSDKEIWNAFKADSRIAYRVIYEKHVDALYNYGNKITPHCEIVEDCIQELFINLWIKKSKLGVVVNIKAYLFTSFRRRLIDLLKKRRKELLVENIDNFEVFFGYSSENDFISDDKRISILNTLNALSTQKKEAIFLRFYNDLSCSEVAEIMEIKAQSVYNLISSGLRTMREALKNAKF